MGSALSYPITTLGIERVGDKTVCASAVSMQGWRADMEDGHNIATDINPEGVSLYGVYDGHGGYKAALYLSQVMPEVMAQVKDLGDPNVEETITRIMVKEVDQKFLDQGLEDGSTCCFVLTQPWDQVANKPLVLGKDESVYDHPSGVMRCLAVNIGDSRAMIIRSSGEWVALTKDHKPSDDCEKKRIYEAMGTVHGNRVDGNLALSRAIGDAQYKKNHTLPAEKQKVIAVPDFQSDNLMQNDILLVACDGIFEGQRMDWEQVAGIVYDSVSRLNARYNNDVWDTAIVARDILEQSLLNDSRDNHTAIVVRFVSGKNFINAQRPAKEVIPGRFLHRETDESFKAAYIDDLHRYGLSLKDEEVKEGIAKIEEIITANNDDDLISSDTEVRFIHFADESQEAAANKANAGGFAPDVMQQFISLLRNVHHQEDDDDEE